MQERRSKPIFFDTALSSNSNYMNVIKESHESIIRRKFLDSQKRRILDMDITKVPKSNPMDLTNLNNFLVVRQQELVKEKQAGHKNLDIKA